MFGKNDQCLSFHRMEVTKRIAIYLAQAPISNVSQVDVVSLTHGSAMETLTVKTHLMKIQQFAVSPYYLTVTLELSLMKFTF